MTQETEATLKKLCKDYRDGNHAVQTLVGLAIVHICCRELLDKQESEG